MKYKASLTGVFYAQHQQARLSWPITRPLIFEVWPIWKEKHWGIAVPILAMQGSFYETLPCHAPICLDKQ